MGWMPSRGMELTDRSCVKGATMASFSQADAHKKVRVLLLDTNDAMGGVVRVHLELLKAIDRTRFHITAACLKRGHVFSAFRAVSGIRLLPMEVGTKPSMLGTSLRAKLTDAVGLVPFMLSIARLAVYAFRNRIQIIHTSDKKRSLFMAYLVHRIAGIPFVYHIHGDFVDFRFSRKILHSAAAVVAVCQDRKDFFIRSVGHEMKRIHVVRNGVDPKVFRPGNSTLRSELNLGEKHILVGMASRLAPDKGQETFLRAAADVAAKYNHVHFVLAGDDSIFSDNKEYVPFLYGLLEELGLSGCVHFLGLRHDMVNVYNALDMVVNASVSEAMPMAVLEPMACGKLVVGTRTGGTPEIIQDGVNGFLFPLQDHVALGGILESLVSQPELREKVSGQAHRTILEQFTTEIQARAIEKIYGQIVGWKP